MSRTPNQSLIPALASLTCYLTDPEAGTPDSQIQTIVDSDIAVIIAGIAEGSLRIRPHALCSDELETVAKRFIREIRT